MDPFVTRCARKLLVCSKRKMIRTRTAARWLPKTTTGARSPGMGGRVDGWEGLADKSLFCEPGHSGAPPPQVQTQNITVDICVASLTLLARRVNSKVAVSVFRVPWPVYLSILSNASLSSTARSRSNQNRTGPPMM